MQQNIEQSETWVRGFQPAKLYKSSYFSNKINISDKDFA